jgi:hypothetical protein
MALGKMIKKYTSPSKNGRNPNGDVANTDNPTFCII